MPYTVSFFSNTEENVLVAGHKGKLMLDGREKPFKGQKGLTCSIESRQRLRLIVGKAAESSEELEVQNARKAEKALKSLKVVMSKPALDYEELHETSVAILQSLGYVIEEEIFKNPYFVKLKHAKIAGGAIPESTSSIRVFRTLVMKEKAQVTYSAVLEALDAQLGLKNAEWSIESGFEGLRQALITNGQIMFQGKFGRCFYGAGDVIHHPDESTEDRKAFYFRKNTIRASAWTHCVVVDQVKLVNGVPFVFFKDPYDVSKPGQADNVYMISYQSFVERLSDRYGIKREASEEATFGVCRKW
ncbi:hypothetical protein BN59_01420 [Legionella massiliensis]|uniref:Uncharacterized protein n=1 Tax=Legionella massiliensis TaxID=1034943 RepID=A0A078KZG3_9GAMM|nr:hypothetical protein [Legionella massiliensis]CDZ77138.1 hypothetical protein BN59_01420 [Legionella massiliensis]CEE12876.1 hypothetical protein BN1094_01420 [Legionella massiliensis]